MRRVLIISTYFAANVAIGSARIAGLAKYLGDAGWAPTVLSPRVPEEPALPRDRIELVEYEDLFGRAKRALGRQPHESFSLPEQSRRESVVSRARRAGMAAAQYLTVPDPSIAWYPTGLQALRRLKREGRSFDVVLSSSNPKTPHLLGRSAGRIFDAPWVADLRDFWTIDHYYPYGWPRLPLERRLERRVLGDADALVTVSAPYAHRLGEFLGREVHTVLNGFDPADWNDPPAPLTEKLTITYTGSLALGRRDPTILLESLRRLGDRQEIRLEDVEVRFYGRHDPALETLTRRLRLDGVVRQLGYQPRADALERQRESHVLLILFWDHPLEEGVLTGKLEYLAARRPILGLGGPGGAMEELLRETGAGEYVHAGDTAHLEDLLRQWYREFASEGAVRYRGDSARVLRLSQAEVAGRFGEIFDALVRE